MDPEKNAHVLGQRSTLRCGCCPLSPLAFSLLHLSPSSVLFFELLESVSACAASLEEMGTDPAWSWCGFPTCMQGGYRSLMLPNNSISKTPYKNLSNQASDKGLSVYLFEQYQIATICSSHLVSLFQSHFMSTGFSSARIREDGVLVSCLNDQKSLSFLGRFFFLLEQYCF